MKGKSFFLLFLMVLNAFIALGQYQDKDLNVQKYTPSVLLNPGQWEFKNFNNLYTQISGFDNQGEALTYNQRSTYLTSINQFLYGVNENISAGFDLWIRSAKIDAIDSSPVHLFKFGNTPNSRTALAYMGPKIKFSPAENVNRLSLQSTFLLPVAVDLESVKKDHPFLGDDAYRWINQLFYDRNINEDLQVFLELATWWGINRNGADTYNKFESPVKAFISYFPDKRFTVFGKGVIWPSFGSNIVDAYFVQTGFGLKYQLISGFLEGEVSYGKFVAGKNKGAGSTFNLGIRVIQ